LRLHQVLVNLVGNAVKFTEEGEVRISVHAHHAPPAAPTLCVRVADTGIGIDASQIERIFAPFAQADGSITRRFGGTGLGLSISRRLAELMGGTLSVRSQPGQGAEFTLEVPFSPVEQVPAEAPPELLIPTPTLTPTPLSATATATATASDPANQTASAPAAALRPAHLAALEPLLQELDGLLSLNMLTARRVAERVRAELHGTSCADDFGEVEQDIARLRFRAARAHLASMRARWADASSGPASTPAP
jgi:anti-sigma regulatory factor (Ser/Thr protein kinase)